MHPDRPPEATPTPAGDSDAIDRALLAAAAGGDVSAFERLYRRHFPRVFRFAARISGSLELAGEVAGDSFAIAWRNARAFEGRSRVSTWLLGIAYRIAARARLRDARHAGHAALEDVEHLAVVPASTVEAGVLAHRLSRALARLPPAQRAVVELTHVHGLGYAEIATALDCPVGTVKTRMLHARRRLRAELCGEGDEHAR